MEGLDADLDETSLQARLAAGPPPPVVLPGRTEREAQEKPDPAAKEIAAQGDQSLVDWFKSFSGSPFKISLARTSPELWQGRPVSGHLGNFDELIDEEYVANRYGGGKYQIRAMKTNGQGKQVYAGARSFKVAGDPKLSPEHFSEKEKPDLVPLAPIVPNADAEVTKAAMASMERFSIKAIERAERIEDQSQSRSSPAFDPTLITMLTKPLESQIVSLNAQLAAKDVLLLEKDRTIKELSERKPETTYQDKLLDKMYEGESSKLNALRTQFDSERRVMQENHAEAVKRLEHRSDNERQNLIEAHKRELKALEMSFDHQLKATDLSHKGLLDAKENRVKDLERTITKLDAEIVELRSKKEKSILEQMRELGALKESLSALSGGDEGEEQTTVEKVMGALADNPIVQGLGRRLAEGPPNAPRAPQPRPQQLAERKARARQVMQQQQPGQAPAPAPASEPKAQGLPPGVSADGVQAAVSMMEGAVTNGTEPEVFAQSVRGMVPGGVINYIQVHGIDSLLDGVARLSEASPLSTQVGRLYARRVAKALAV